MSEAPGSDLAGWLPRTIRHGRELAAIAGAWSALVGLVLLRSAAGRTRLGN